MKLPATINDMDDMVFLTHDVGVLRTQRMNHPRVDDASGNKLGLVQVAGVTPRTPPRFTLDILVVIYP